MISFGDSLKEILNNRYIKVKDYAEAVNISQATAYSWINNTTEPNLSYLISSADYFKCPIEFLIGRSENEIHMEGKNYPPFTKRIREIMRETKISTYKLRKISKYDGAYFYNWEHGSEPLLSTLIELSDILDCTIDYLIGRE
jgi:transcriptional regulator with XRE-family HTH domain